MTSGTEVQGSSAVPDGALPLILHLARVLDDEGVAYCHWKSNAEIDRSLSGENDLDLLVARASVRPFTEALLRLGFVRVERGGPSIPGIESFYGFDPEADRLVHVHAHHALVVGDDRTKNYRLPIEDAYIASARHAGVLPLPSPELEYAVLVIRMVLKYCTWDEIAWSALRRRGAGPTRSERHELQHFAARVDPERVGALVDEHLPAVGASLFRDCVDAVGPDVAVERRLGTGRRLERSLQSTARSSRKVDRALRIWRRTSASLARRTGRRPRSRLAAAGAIVAVLGGDGAGKSTALATLRGWLGPTIDVRVVHLGKPPWSATTYGTRATLKGASMTAAALKRLVPVEATSRLSDLVEQYRPLVWLVCTARDRQLAYRSARTFADSGGLVLCDRYPHPRLTSMEVPLIAARTQDVGSGRLLDAMIRLEERYHRSIATPELLVVLRLDPELAVRRKTEERPSSVRARGAEIWHIDWRQAGAHVVDASRPADAVARELKTLVWSSLL
jgi:thymidylate kinase